MDLESDYESEEENNVPPHGLDPEFCRRIQTMKWKIYQMTVLSPEENTSEAQNNNLIERYLQQLESLYQLLEKAQRGGSVERELISFPHELRSENHSIAEWIRTYVKQNGPADTIPYQDYLTTTLRIYPFVHHMRMVGGERDVEEM